MSHSVLVDFSEQFTVLINTSSNLRYALISFELQKWLLNCIVIEIFSLANFNLMDIIDIYGVKSFPVAIIKTLTSF